MGMAAKQTRRAKASDRVDFDKYIDGMINAGWTGERRKNMKNNGMDIYDETIIKEVNEREVDALSDSEIALIMNHAMLSGFDTILDALMTIVTSDELMELYGEVIDDQKIYAIIGSVVVAKRETERCGEENIDIEAARTMIAKTVKKFKEKKININDNSKNKRSNKNK